jgi:hypothetical protein
VPTAHLRIDFVDGEPEIVELRAKLFCGTVNVLEQRIAWSCLEARDVIGVEWPRGLVRLWQARTRHAKGIGFHGWPVQAGHCV